ncbi:MAG: DUF624 domain-containing protein [Enterococcus lemanii]|jgi:uncharacterized membrane protein YesL
MKYKPNNSFVKGLNTSVQFVLLNVIYLLLCLPIVTIGVATSALFEVTLKYADHEKGYLLLGFFHALKENWKKATAAYLILGVPLLLMSYSSVFWLSMGQSIITTIIGFLSLIFIGYLWIVLTYSLALIARFDTSFKQTLKNAFLLPLAEPTRSLGLLLIPITCLCLIILFPNFKLLLLLFGFSFMNYVSSFLLLAIFKKQGAMG